MVIVVPPSATPEGGDTPVIVGGRFTCVKPPALVAVPPGVVTVTVFAPAVPAGVTAVIVVGFTTTTLVAEAVPILTEVAPVKFVPVIVIAVPPRAEPELGVTDAIVGNEK
jgi:hypothetical protein